MTQTIKSGDTISVDYTGRFQNGKVFDTSEGLSPEDGYGLRDEELYVDIPKMHFPKEIPLTQGLQLELQDPEGRPVPASVAEIREDFVRMDINHFLAGKTLEFDITIIETGLEPDSHDCGSGCSCDSGCCH